MFGYLCVMALSKVYQHKLHISEPFGVRKWIVGSKNITQIRRSMPLKVKVSIIISVIISALIIALFLVCYFRIKEKNNWMPHYESASKLGKFKSAAISTDAAPCAIIGKEMMMRNGSVVDAAIAVLLCMGVVNPQSAGIGGGFFMIYYNNKEKKAHFMDAREVAPLKATEDMYQGNSTLSEYGGLAIAVPSEIAGYYELHKRYGILPWEELFPPTIQMCREGLRVNAHLARALRKYEQKIYEYEHISKIFVDSSTGKIYKENDVYKRHDLANTLEIIARDKAEALYGNHALAKQFLKDLQDAGSIIEEEDLRNYKPRFRKPTAKKLSNNHTLYSASVPGSGALLAFMLGVMGGYEDLAPSIAKSRGETVITLHRMIETFKYAYAHRMYMEDSDDEDIVKLQEKLASDEYADNIRKLIDDTRTFNVSHYAPDVTITEDHGTSHVSLLAPNGDAVCVTTTINQYFGSMIVSPSTGIILNNEMDDFSSSNITNKFDVPPTLKNHIRPGRRPFSSMSPAILVDPDGEVKLVVGGNGGTQITSSVAQIIIRTMWLNNTIKEAIDAPRFHHQLLPNRIEHEEKFPQDVLGDLHNMGHDLHLLGSGMLGIIMAIIRGEDGQLYANSDYRKGGEVDGF